MRPGLCIEMGKVLNEIRARLLCLNNICKQLEDENIGLRLEIQKLRGRMSYQDIADEVIEELKLGKAGDRNESKKRLKKGRRKKGKQGVLRVTRL